MVKNRLPNILVWVFGMSLVSFFFASPVLAFSGSRTRSDPYVVITCAQIEEILNDLTAYYQKANNIDCTGTTFQPVGNNSNFFMGTYDGQNYTVSNVTISTGPVPQRAGFFVE